MVWNVVNFWPVNQLSAPIPYGALLGEIYRINIFRFYLVSDETSGPFAIPHLLPASPESIIDEDVKH